jgi:hypothetical protein
VNVFTFDWVGIQVPVCMQLSGIADIVVARDGANTYPKARISPAAWRKSSSTSATSPVWIMRSGRCSAIQEASGA